MTIVKTIAALTLLLAASPSAQAADIYNQGGGLKDGPVQYAPADHTGFAVRAFIGYSWGDRDVDTSAQAFLNCNNAYELSTDADERAAQLKEIETYVAEANKAGVFATSSHDDSLAKVVIPLIGAMFSHSDSDKFGSLVYGAELEHLWQRGSWGFGIVGGVTGYGGADTKTSFAGAPTSFAPGTLLVPEGSSHAGETIDGLTVSGFTSVDRQYDIDFALKLYGFVTPDTAFFIKGGPSIAKASIKSHTEIDGLPGAALDYSDSQTAIGYVVGLGVIHWVNPNLSVSLDGDYKQHSFDAKGSTSADITDRACGCNDGIDVQAKGKTSVDDSVFTVKAEAAYHF